MQKTDDPAGSIVQQVWNVLDDSRLTGAERLLLLHYRRRGTTNDPSWWSDKNTAAAIGMSIPTLRRARERLRQRGLITTAVRQGRSLNVYLVPTSLQGRLPHLPTPLSTTAIKMIADRDQNDRAARSKRSIGPPASFKRIRKGITQRKDDAREVSDEELARLEEPPADSRSYERWFRARCQMLRAAVS